MKKKTNKIKKPAVYTKKAIGKFIYNDTYEIDIKEVRSIEGGVEVFASATKDGQPVGFGADGTVEIERFRIFNPPVLVDDPNGDIVREWVDNKTGETKVRALREDHNAALRASLGSIVLDVAKDGANVIQGKRGNTTSTFYPTVDELVAHFGLDLPWADMRASAGNFHETAVNADIKIEYSATTNQYEEIHRYHHFYNCTAIGSDNITSATFSYYLDVLTDQVSGNASANSAAVLVESLVTSDSTIANSDFEITNFNTTDFGRTGAQNTLSTGAYTSITLNASGIANIKKTSGTTKFGLLYGWDFDDLAPHSNGATWGSGNEIRQRFYQADQTGTANDPKLVVEHSAGAVAPTVTTQAVTSIAETTATGNGNVTADGGATITERGVCWATSTSPTTADSTATSAGTTGAFTASMTGLTAGTLYYVRAYAINSEGTSYGSEVTFTTDAVPDAFVIGDWALTDLATGGDARIAISTLPADNGAAITDLEYKKDAGAWTSLAGTATGNYDLIGVFTDGVSANIQIRAVNAVGNGADSDTKAVTTTAAATAPAQFATDGWSVADRATDGAIRITITTLPDDGGSAITDLEYQLDAGSWVTMGTTTTGTFDITGLTNGQEYDVAVRAVNSVGNGTASATKAVTPTLAPAYVGADTDVIYVLDKSNTTNSTEGELVAVALSDLKTYFNAS